MKHARTLLFALTFLLLLLLPTPALAEVEATPLSLDTPANVVIAEEGGYAWFSFTPDTTDEYQFISDNNNGDPYGELYDVNMRSLASDDDGFKDVNFSITASLVKGHTYYLRARLYSKDDTGEYTVMVRMSNHLTASAEGSDEIYITPGESVELKVNASCNVGELHYQWRGPDENGNYHDIEGETGTTFTTDAVVRKTYYYCLVTDDFDSIMDVRFDIYIDNHLTASAEGNTDIYIASGESVELKVNASCDEGEIHYQWRRTDENGNWQDIEGETGTTLTTGAAVRTTCFECRVTDDYGNSRDICFYIYIDNHLTASAEGNTNIYITPGESAELKVNASCDVGELHYQWRESDEHDYMYDIEGETGTTLTTEAVVRRVYYDCCVTDDFGNRIYVGFNVYIDNQLKAAPRDSAYVYVAPGETAELAVNASCTVGALHYQWYDNSGALEGKTSAVLVVEDVTEASSFNCYVTDDYGNGVYVYMYTRLDNRLSAESASGESTVYVQPGESATFAVNATCAAGEIHYQWSVYDTTEYDYLELDGETDSALTVGPVQGYTRYRCVVTDDYGSSRTLSFYADIENHFDVRRASEHEVHVPIGDSTTLQVAASCDDGRLSYQWRFEDGDDIEGATGNSLVLKDIRAPEDYECRVWDAYGHSDVLCFHVYVDSGLVVDDPKKTITVSYGQTVKLKVSAYVDDGQLDYIWTRRYIGEATEEISDAHKATLTTEAITRNAVYTCEVRDQYGNYRKKVFTIKVDTGLTVTPVGSTEIVRSDAEQITLAVNAQCQDENLTYTWSGKYYNLETHGWTYIDDVDGSSYTLGENQAYGSFICEVKDSYGNSEEVNFEVRLDTGFSASAVGSSIITLSAGNTATLKVSASVAMGQLSYQWYQDDDRIEGATASQYVTPPLKNVETDFRCVVSDEFGHTQRIEFKCLTGLETLEAGKDLSFSFREDERRWYLFTPASSEIYTFASYGDSDPRITLYDDQCEEIGDSDDANNYNFRLTKMLTANRSYLVRLRIYGRGNFTMAITKANDDVSTEMKWTLRKGQAVIVPPYDGIAVAKVESTVPSVVRVSGNRVTALKNGFATLKVTYDDDWYRYYGIKVVSESAATLPAALKTIEPEAFAQDSSLRFLELGDAVGTIGRDAFNGSGLVQIVVSGIKTTAGGCWLRGTDNVTIICRKGSRVEQYAIANELDYLYLP